MTRRRPTRRSRHDPRAGERRLQHEFTVAATGGGSGNPVTFSSGGVCTNTGATFTMTSGTGTCTVKYDQAGDANYNAAPQVTETVTAQKADQTITVTTHAPASAVFNTSSRSRRPAAARATPVTFSSAGACSNTGAHVHDDQRHGHLHGQVRPGRRRELQRRAAGHRDGDRAEGGPDDHRHDARAGDGRLQHELHGRARTAARATRHVLERRRLLEHRRHVHDDERHRHLHGQVRPGRRRELQRRAAGHRVGDRAEGRPDDHGHDARAGERRLQHEFTVAATAAARATRSPSRAAAPARTSAPRSR